MPTRREFLELSAAALATMASPNANMQSPQLPVLTIAEAAARLSRKQLSPMELTRAVLARVEALNPRIGAFITVAADQAMEAARAAERHLNHGLEGSGDCDRPAERTAVPNVRKDGRPTVEARKGVGGAQEPNER